LRDNPDEVVTGQKPPWATLWRAHGDSCYLISHTSLSNCPVLTARRREGSHMGREWPQNSFVVPDGFLWGKTLCLGVCLRVAETKWGGCSLSRNETMEIVFFLWNSS
jgi:hypothetical protein